MARRVRRFFISVSVTALSVIVTLAAVELGIRIFSPQAHFSVVVNVWDKRLGITHVPNSRGRLRTPEFDTGIVINSKGLRDREYAYAKPDSTKRILCLGDSFTFGYGVEWKETYAKVLEKLLDCGKVNGMRWQVVNAGVGGTGAAHQLAYLEVEGLKYDPDIVMVCICGANDFSDNSMYGLYSLEDGGLVRHEAHLPSLIRLRLQLRHIMLYLPGYRTLFGESHLITFIRYRIARHAYARRASNLRDPATIEAGRKRAYELTEALFSALQARCQAAGADLIVIAVPEVDGSPPPERVANLISFIRSQGISYVDLEQRFRQEQAAGAEVFYPLDTHWNSNGHGLVAELLYEYLASPPRRLIRGLPDTGLPRFTEDNFGLSRIDS